MGKHCDVTGELSADCPCGAHDDDDGLEPWRKVPFHPPPGPDGDEAA